MLVFRVSLDAIKWAESASTGEPVVSGRLSGPTIEWALSKIAQAGSAGKKVIAFMHHGVNPHFMGEPVVFPGYLGDNWPVLGAQLAAAGLKVVFTGHNHGHPASSWTLNASGEPVPTSLCNIETGSLVSYPCAYRIGELDNAGVLHVTSPRVTQVNADLGGLSFPAYAENFARAMLPYRVVAELQQMFGLPPAEAQAVAPLVVDAIIAYYCGDENPSATTQATLAYLLSQPEPQHTLGALLYTFWNDLPPADNTLNVSLQ